MFPASIEREVSPDRLRRFFVKTDGRYRVSKAIRDACVFARQDVTRDPPFSRLDLISCCNVLIYLGATLQERVIPTFHYALKPTGFLRLGPSESVGPVHEPLRGRRQEAQDLCAERRSVGPRRLRPHRP